jgi:hypothetical protein
MISEVSLPLWDEVTGDAERHIGSSSPKANSAVLLLSGPQPLQAASASCAALGEQLWSPDMKTTSIQSSLDYIVYEKLAAAGSDFWIAGGKSITAKGAIGTGKSDGKLPVLCTQSAPFSNDSVEDTSEKWQVMVHSNNEDLVGYVRESAEMTSSN